MLKVRTQKAKGVLFGLDWLEHNYKFSRFFHTPTHGLIQDEEEFDSNSITLPCFARPCPTVPKHGFVDSKVVKNRTQLKKLWKEIIKEDSKGELLIGPYLPNVKANLVYVTSGMLSVGVGNDGATAGKKSISFPVAPEKFPQKFMKICGLTKEDAVYIEAVLNDEGSGIGKDVWKFTQARGGPKLNTTSPDYIPKKVKVKKVVKPHNDLLRWEKETKKFKPGTVVYSEDHTLASHAAIHCVLNKIPFITTKKPKIGDTLIPSKTSRIRLRRRNFKAGVRAAINICRKGKHHKDLIRFFYFSLSVLHNWVYIQESEHADWLLGASSTMLAKICTALVLGEYRHKRGGKDKGKKRETIYNRSFRKHSDALSKLPEAFKSFYSDSWNGGFGGLPWATCAWYSYSLWEHIVRLYNRKSTNLTDKEKADIVTVMNKTINLAHNNGWWFNKFATKDDLDFIAEHSGLASMCVAELFLDIHKKVSASKKAYANMRKMKTVSKPFWVNSEGSLAWVGVSGHDQWMRPFIKYETGKKKTGKLQKLSKKEIDYVKRHYKKKGVDGIILHVTGDSFRLPGGSKRSIRKVFGEK